MVFPYASKYFSFLPKAGSGFVPPLHMHVILVLNGFLLV